MDKFQEEITKILKKLTGLKDISLEVPPNSELGDYAFPCFALSKEMKKSPVEIAKELVGKIKLDDMIKEVKPTGPYLNFFVNRSGQSKDLLKSIIKKGDSFGSQKSTGKKILVEFPGPNTNKPLHLGHVRNIVIGTALTKILELNGNKVVHVNVNNDRGIAICKSMLAYQKWGKGDTPEKSKMKSDFFVGKYYVLFAQKVKDNTKLEDEAQEMVRKWEAGDKEVLALWKKMNKWAFDGFKTTYKKFEIKPEKEYYESDTYKNGKDIILKGLSDGLFEKGEEGEVFVDLEDKGYGKKVLLRADGTTVYITQDIYLAKIRYEDFKFDKSIYVVATEQNYHFKVLFEVLKLLKYPFADKLHHFAYGMVNLTTGKMKSREGTVVDADNLIDDMTNIARDLTNKKHGALAVKDLEHRSNEIAMAAIRFYLLKHDPVKDMLFDPEKSISFEGETGPYLQYTYARINSIIAKYGGEVGNKVDSTLLKEKEELELIKILSNFEEMVKSVGSNYKIHVLTRYLLDLSQAFNNFYHNYPVLKAEEDLMKARILLISCVKQIIKNGLNMLGIKVLERM
jgi:arginyl-tRNA synthetase